MVSRHQIIKPRQYSRQAMAYDNNKLQKDKSTTESKHTLHFTWNPKNSPTISHTKCRVLTY